MFMINKIKNNVNRDCEVIESDYIQWLIFDRFNHKKFIMATNALKTLVSKKKLRYKKDGFNLDLTYINGKNIYYIIYSTNSWSYAISRTILNQIYALFHFRSRHCNGFSERECREHLQEFSWWSPEIIGGKAQGK